MRIALDNSYLIESGEQGSFVDYDGVDQLMVTWDNRRRLSLIPDVDKYGALRTEQLDAIFDQLKPLST